MPPKKKRSPKPLQDIQAPMDVVLRAIFGSVCIEGERAGPPENCGGVPGYEHLLGVLRDPRNEEHRDLLDSVGEDFDPELFDAKAATWQMRKYN